MPDVSPCELLRRLQRIVADRHEPVPPFLLAGGRLQVVATFGVHPLHNLPHDLFVIGGQVHAALLQNLQHPPLQRGQPAEGPLLIAVSSHAVAAGFGHQGGCGSGQMGSPAHRRHVQVRLRDDALHACTSAPCRLCP
jgi:hypothetical protein